MVGGVGGVHSYQPQVTRERESEAGVDALTAIENKKKWNRKYGTGKREGNTYVEPFTSVNANPCREVCGV